MKLLNETAVFNILSRIEGPVALSIHDATNQPDFPDTLDGVEWEEVENEHLIVRCVIQPLPDIKMTGLRIDIKRK